MTPRATPLRLCRICGHSFRPLLDRPATARCPVCDWEVAQVPRHRLSLLLVTIILALPIGLLLWLAVIVIAMLALEVRP